MTTLTIPEIFANFSFYQKEYPSIIADQSQYETIVEGAYISIGPIIPRLQLYLGDLLYLWFHSKKWVINTPALLRSGHPHDGRKTPVHREYDFYLYRLSGSALSGSNSCSAWSLSEQDDVLLQLKSAMSNYPFIRKSNGQTNLKRFRFSIDGGNNQQA